MRGPVKIVPVPPAPPSVEQSARPPPIEGCLVSAWALSTQPLFRWLRSADAKRWAVLTDASLLLYASPTEITPVEEVDLRTRGLQLSWSRDGPAGAARLVVDHPAFLRKLLLWTRADGGVGIEFWAARIGERVAAAAKERGTPASPRVLPTLAQRSLQTNTVQWRAHGPARARRARALNPPARLAPRRGRVELLCPRRRWSLTPEGTLLVTPEAALGSPPPPQLAAVRADVASIDSLLLSVLKRKAGQGVRVYVLLWNHSRIAFRYIYSSRVRRLLEARALVPPSHPAPAHPPAAQALDPFVHVLKASERPIPPSAAGAGALPAHCAPGAPLAPE
eukprot:tig00020734_g13604.t1